MFFLGILAGVFFVFSLMMAWFFGAKIAVTSIKNKYEEKYGKDSFGKMCKDIGIVNFPKE